jgi:hypothetical protein
LDLTRTSLSLSSATMRGMPGFMASWKVAKTDRQSSFGVATQIDSHSSMSLPNDSAALDLTHTSQSPSSVTTWGMPGFIASWKASKTDCQNTSIW